MTPKSKTNQQALLRETAELRARLDEAEETLTFPCRMKTVTLS